LPPGWYDSLIELGFENFFVVADQNQQITDENSSRTKLQKALGLEANQFIELKENFRNTTPISIFSNCFYTDKTSPKPYIPDRPSTDTPILYEFTHIDVIPKRILDEYHRDPSKLIGFIVPTENKREWYVRVLGNDQVHRNNPKPVISTYASSQKTDVNIDFSNGGIVVLCDKSVKGVEFDTVFIILMIFTVVNNDFESLQKRFYVMSSRAKEKLFLFKSAVRPSLIEEILPKTGKVYEFSGEDGKLYKKSGEEILKWRKI